MSNEPEILEDEEASPLPTDEEISAFVEKLSKLEERCKLAKIDFQQDIDEDGDIYATINIQSGKSKRSIGIFSHERADLLLSIQFENIRFMSGYQGIYSIRDRTAEISLRSTRLSAQSILRRLNNLSIFDTTDPDPVTFSPSNATPDRPEIEIGPCTSEFKGVFGGRGPKTTTIKFSKLRANQHDNIIEEVRPYADSIFFQIDMIIGFTFILERERRPTHTSGPRRRPEITLTYPVARYNEESMSLYWYAKSARDMPLLRFLAFYQSIEFYFPRYSQTEARKRVSSIIKNPTFRAHRDDDLDRLISAIQTARGNGFGNEKSQLRAVINECMSADEIRTFLVADKEREAHFSGKTKAKYHKIPLSNKNADLRVDVADRIYDIRCKIVHTKNEHSEDDFPMILPFSDDAIHLMHDIDLVEFVARNVMVSSSGELS